MGYDMMGIIRAGPPLILTVVPSIPAWIGAGNELVMVLGFGVQVRCPSTVS
jgi:hypothetical protein